MVRPRLGAPSHLEDADPPRFAQGVGLGFVTIALAGFLTGADVIGYGGTLTIPTLDIISTERNIIGNIVGTYNDLVELMALAQAGKVTLHTKAYALDDAQQALADLDAGNVRGRAILVP